MTYPNDDNGNVLRRLEEKGDDLSRPRDIDFTVVFPNEFTAKEFAAHFREAGYTATVEYTQTKKNHPWDVVVVNHMAPSHAGVTEFEQELQGVADPLGGYNDGWGCFSGPAKHLQ